MSEATEIFTRLNRKAAQESLDRLLAEMERTGAPPEDIAATREFFGDPANAAPLLPIPNYNGGAGDMGGENPTDRQLQEIYAGVGVAARYLSFALRLSEIAVSTSAKVKLQSDLKSAKDKIDKSTGNMIAKNREIEEVAGKIEELGGNVDELRDQIHEIYNLALPKLNLVNTLKFSLGNFIRELDAANINLSQAEARLNSIVRSNYPAGTDGSKAYTDARNAALKDVAAAKTRKNTAEQNVSKTQSELSTATTDYTATIKPGIEKSLMVNQYADEIAKQGGIVATKYRELGGPLAQRGEAIRDAVRAQEIYGKEMKQAYVVGGAAVAMQGVGEVFDHMGAGRYYMASASIVSRSLNLTGYFSPEIFMPYFSLMQKASLEAGKVLEGGGDFQLFVENLSETLLATDRASQLLEGIKRAELWASHGDIQTAANILVDETGVGIGILGTIAETVTPFVSSGIPVGPIIRPATTIAKQGATGVLQTGVNLGYLNAQNRLVSARLGSGQISGGTQLLGMIPGIVWGIINEMKGSGDTAAQLLRSMAENGVSRIMFRLDPTAVTLRPTVPDDICPNGAKSESYIGGP